MKVPNRNTTVIVCNNQAELDYMIRWNTINGNLPSYAGERESYPICISLDSGWTDSMDRALTYISFKEFIIDDCVVETV